MKDTQMKTDTIQEDSTKEQNAYQKFAHDNLGVIKFIILLLTLMILPLFFGDSTIYTLTWICTLGVAAIGYNVIYGYTGMLSFGHGAFWGVGAYTVALLSQFTSVESLLVTLAVGALIAAIVALIIGTVSLQSKDIYYSLLTLALAQLVWVIVFTETLIPSGGINGIAADLPKFVPMGYETSDNIVYVTEFYYFFVAIVSLLVISALWVLLSSPLGLMLKSVRDNEVRSSALGLPTKRYKLYATIISGWVVGLGGAMYAVLFSYVTPSATHWTMSGDIIFMVLLGGASSFLGPIVGAIGYIAIREYMTELLGISWRFTVGTLLLVSVITLKQGGIWGWMKTTIRYLNKNRGWRTENE